MKQEVKEIDYEDIKNSGITKIIFDYDGTLGKRFSLPDKKLIQFLKKLAKTFEVLVFSNNIFLGRKRKELFAKHGITYIQTFKPFFF